MEEVTERSLGRNLENSWKSRRMPARMVTFVMLLTGLVAFMGLITHSRQRRSSCLCVLKPHLSFRELWVCI
jgi:hypothetical protein